MASGSSGNWGSGGKSKRNGAQSRLHYSQMRTNKNTARQARRMRIARANSSIPF